MINNTKLNVKSLCLLKEKQNENAGSHFRLRRCHEREWVYDNDEEMKKINVIDVLCEEKQENVCMLLDEDSCDEMLFYKMLDYAVKMKIKGITY